MGRKVYHFFCYRFLVIFFTLIILLKVNGTVCEKGVLSESAKEQFAQPVLYCPWRESYIEKISKNVTQKKCVFCLKISEKTDETNFILKRFKHHVVMLNSFPMRKGHLLIVPFYHVENINDLSKEARRELIEIINQSVEVLKKEFGTRGANVGFNLGEKGGASIPDHLHAHVLPRGFPGLDYLEMIGRVKVIPWDMSVCYQKLKRAFEAVYISLN